MSFQGFNRGRKESRRILCRILVYALNHPGASATWGHVKFLWR